MTRPEWDPVEFERDVAPEELQRASRFCHRLDAGRFLASRALLREVLSHVLGVAPGEIGFDRTCAHCGDRQHGRPEVRAGLGHHQGAGPVAGGAGPLANGASPLAGGAGAEAGGAGPEAGPVGFSLTRRGPIVAVAVAAGPIGLDIEAVVPDARGLTGSGVFAPTEQDWLSAAPSDRQAARAISLWVAKEAIGKASGLGLHQAERIQVPLDASPASGWQWATDASGRACWLCAIDVPGAVAAAVASYQPHLARLQVTPVTAIDDVIQRW